MSMRKGKTFLAVLASLAVIVPVLSPQYRVKTENGVAIVTNGRKPVPPRGAPVKLVFEEVYTIGGGDSPDASFVAASDLDVLQDGTVYVLDTKDSRVKVFDAGGRFLRAFGRAGQGPGELNQPAGILIAPENEVLVEDILNRRLAVFALDGTFKRQISTAKSLGLSGIQMDGRGLIVARSMGLGEGGKLSMDVKTYDRELNPKVKLASFEFPISSQTKINPFSAMNLLYALDGQGLLYLGNAREYEIRVVSADGKLLKTIGREYDPVVITQSDKDEMLKTITGAPGVNVKDMLQFPDAYPPFSNFILAEEGRLLVRTFEKGPAKKEFYWDVFDADGRYIAKVPIVHDIQLWRDGKAYFFVEDEDGYRLLRCCRVRWDR